MSCAPPLLPTISSICDESQAIHSGIEDLLACRGCDQRFTIESLPKLLPCHHSFCLQCIAKFPNECQTCHQVYMKPQCLNDLPTNFYLVAILEAKEPAMKQQKKQADNKQNEGDVCKSHGKSVTYYCSTCSLFICNQCIVEHNKANNHSIEDIDRYLEHCKETLADRSAVANAAIEARQQYMKTLKTELEQSQQREHEVSNQFEQIFKEIFLVLGEVRKDVEENIRLTSKQVNNRLSNEISKMEEEAEKLDTVRRLCDDVQKRNDARTIGACYNSQDLLEIVDKLSNQIETVPRVNLQPNEKPLRKLLELCSGLVENEFAQGSLAHNETKRPVIVLPKPTVVQDNHGSETENSRDQSFLSPIGETFFTAEQNNVIEVDNVPVRLREKPARRVISSQCVDDICKSQMIYDSKEGIYAKMRHHRRSLVELRQNVPKNKQDLKSSSTFMLMGNTIASNSSSGASSADDNGSSASKQENLPVVGGNQGKTPFIYEFDDNDSGDDSDGKRRTRSKQRRALSASKISNKKSRINLLSPHRQFVAQQSKKFSFGRAISELFGAKKSNNITNVSEPDRKGEAKCQVRAVPATPNHNSNTVTSSDSGADQHSLNSGDRALTPGQMRCISMESMALPQMSSSSKSSSGQKSTSPLPTSPHQRGIKVTEIQTSCDRRASGDFSKRFQLPHKMSKQSRQSKTASCYVPRGEQLPVQFPAKPGQVVSKPPTYQPASTPSTKKPIQPQCSGDLVSVLLSTSSQQSNIHFNPQQTALSHSNSIVANWNAVPTFCQAPTLKFGHQGSAPGAFDWPESIVLAPGGQELYVGDFKNHRIQAFTTMGDFIYEFSVRDGMVDYYPGHMALDPKGDRIVFPWLEKVCYIAIPHNALFNFSFLFHTGG